MGFWARVKSGLDWLQHGHLIYQLLLAGGAGKVVQAMLQKHSQLDPTLITAIWLLVSGVVMAGLVFLGKWLQARKASPAGPVTGDYAIPDYREWKSNVTEQITGRTYTNESVEIDGKVFTECTFQNATLVYHCLAPTTFFKPQFKGTLMVKTDNQAAKAFSEFAESLKQLGANTGAQYFEIGRADKEGNVKTIVRERYAVSPVKAPFVVPVRFGKQDSLYGLFIANDGEPAYDVMIAKFSLGNMPVEISCNVPRLVCSEGEKFCEAWIGQHDGSRLFHEMVSANQDSIEFCITYKDQSNHNYRSICLIERNVMSKGGLDVRIKRQEVTRPGLLAS